MKRQASAEWRGTLQAGSGTVSSASKVLSQTPYSFRSRFADGTETNPEELIAAAHAACFSMAFSNGLAKAGHHPERLNTTAEVEFVPGTGITTITLTVKGHIHGLSDAEFQKLAHEAKEGCPVSKALKGVEIRLKAEQDHAH